MEKMSPSMACLTSSTRNSRSCGTVTVGGAGVGRASVNLRINNSNTIVDHTWIWRADHGAGGGWESNTRANGLVVNGKDVTIYGLFDEQYQEFQVLWNRNGGRRRGGPRVGQPEDQQQQHDRGSHVDLAGGPRRRGGVGEQHPRERAGCEWKRCHHLWPV